jgi:hypothetical protein
MLLFLIPFVVTAGCSSTQSRYPAHNKGILITEGTLPAEVKYEFIESLFVEIDPAPVVAVKMVMADKARLLGGDAIIQFVAGYKPRLSLTFSGRYGSGQVVKITENKEAAMLKSHGEVY